MQGFEASAQTINFPGLGACLRSIQVLWTLRWQRRPSHSQFLVVIVQPKSALQLLYILFYNMMRRLQVWDAQGFGRIPLTSVIMAIEVLDTFVSHPRHRNAIPDTEGGEILG